jgi:tRNA threonylcarbamoyladenosine biosynthesis protein TsaE
MKKMVTSTSVEQTANTARDILNEIVADKKAVSDNVDINADVVGATVLALQGNLGSGKTTFTQAVARELGVIETVTSPTFVIQKNYEITNPRYVGTFKKLIHIDAYRIEDPGELETIGFKKLVTDPDNLILIEWPEKVGELLPAQQTKTIKFTFVDDTRRLIEW